MDFNPSLGLEVFYNKLPQIQQVTPIVHAPFVPELEEIVVIEDSNADYGSEVYKFDKCGQGFQKYKDINDHVEVNHKETPAFNCTKCT